MEADFSEVLKGNNVFGCAFITKINKETKRKNARGGEESEPIEMVCFLFQTENKQHKVDRNIDSYNGSRSLRDSCNLCSLKLNKWSCDFSENLIKTLRTHSHTEYEFVSHGK